MRIKLGTVNITEKTKDLMRKALDENKIGQSEYIEAFEEKFARFMGVKHAIAVCNGTMADTIALATLKALYPLKKKVLVPALTFIAQVNAVYYNHLESVFIDHGADMEADDDTLCAFPVDLLGSPFKNKITAERVVEDACEALGSRRGDKLCGTLGDIGTFSFFPSHSISTGEGGMIVTNSNDFDTVARRLRSQGRRGDNVLDKFHFDEIGFNGRMTTMQAVIGLSVIDDLPRILQDRRRNYVLLGGKDEEGDFTIPHGFPVEYTSKEERNRKLLELESKGIECRKLFSCIPRDEKPYQSVGEYPKAQFIADHYLYVPCHQNLTEEDIEYIKANL